MLTVTLLGTGGMMPLKDRALTSLYAAWNGHALLIDCGEGTQVQLRSAGLSFKAIDAMLLTHYHADHVSGLPGLLLSMGNSGRTAPVIVAGPPRLEAVINGLRIIAPELPFELELRTIDPASPIPWNASGLRIAPFALNHGIPCLGYQLFLPRAGLFDPEKARRNHVPLRCWGILQRQSEVEYEGIQYKQDMVMGPPRKGICIVYATDTRPVSALTDAARGADLLVAEGMYGDDDKRAAAHAKNHMMMDEAAAIAANAGVRRLWLTHFSPAMPDPELWLPAVRTIFPAAELGADGRQEVLRYED